MNAIRALPALLLAAWSLALVPGADALDPVPQCVRDGPPCGVGCVVGNEMDCLVMVWWVVCVTEPCDPLLVCVGRGLYCTDLP